MAVKTGIVMKTEYNKAYIMTTHGEFLNVKVQGSTPEIGSQYTGELITRKQGFFNFRHTAAAAALLMVMLSAGGAYAYNVPVSTVTVSANPVVQIKSNIFKRVIEASSPDENTNKLINSMNLKNTKIDKAVADVTEEIKNKSKDKENAESNQGTESVQKDVKSNKESAPGTSISNENKNSDNTVMDSNQNENFQKWKNGKIQNEIKPSVEKQNNPNKR